MQSAEVTRGASPTGPRTLNPLKNELLTCLWPAHSNFIVLIARTSYEEPEDVRSDTITRHFNNGGCEIVKYAHYFGTRLR
jgi:hypothetical protein